MDVYKTLRDLYEEKKRLDALIASLEKKGGAASAHRRGRRSMGPDERRAVSARMAAYWAARRANGSENGNRATHSAAVS